MQNHQHTRPATARRTAVVLALAVAALLPAAPSAVAQPAASARETADLRAAASATPSGPGDLAAPTPPPPVNDQPKNARNLGSAPDVDLAGQTNAHATSESFAVFDCVGTHRTVWYRWTAPADGIVQFRALSGENGDDHTLAAFATRRGAVDHTLTAPRTGSGAEAGGLADKPGGLGGSVACNDDTVPVGGNNTLDPNINFGVQRGRTYFVAVGAANEFGAGPFVLRTRFVGVTISSAGAAEPGAGQTSVLPVTVELSSSALNPQDAPALSNGLVSVRVADTGTGTATAGVDYQEFPPQDVAFGPGVTSVSGQVTLLGEDEVVTGDRTIVSALRPGRRGRFHIGEPHEWCGAVRPARERDAHHRGRRLRRNAGAQAPALRSRADRSTTGGAHLCERDTLRDRDTRIRDRDTACADCRSADPAQPRPQLGPRLESVAADPDPGALLVVVEAEPVVHPGHLLHRAEPLL